MLLVLLFSQIYSKGIVTPVVELVHHADQMKSQKAGDVERISGRWPKRKDEVRELADTLDDFYLQIRESYASLEEKSRKLEEENERKEVFLRATSHQLKTPIAAALLLVEGMIGRVGRYQDTEKYLPKVKEELLSMRRIVEDILYLNHCPEGGKIWRIDVAALLGQKLREYQVEIAEKELVVELPGLERFEVDTDEVMLGHILDNLLSNAVKYTREKGRIEILLRRDEEGWQIQVENFGVTIPEEILPHVFEPFVRGVHDSGTAMGSHGLGLYLAAYDAKCLGLSLSVENGQNSVVAMLRGRQGA